MSPAALRYYDILKYRIFKRNGCHNKEKRSALFTFLAFKKSSVIFLQETHTDVFNQAEWLSEWKGQVFLSHGSSVSAGVAVLISGSVQGNASNYDRNYSWKNAAGRYFFARSVFFSY